jgi:hypothetical protein
MPKLKQYVGLDVSLEETTIAVIDEMVIRAHVKPSFWLRRRNVRRQIGRIVGRPAAEKSDHGRQWLLSTPCKWPRGMEWVLKL